MNNPPAGVLAEFDAQLDEYMAEWEQSLRDHLGTFAELCMIGEPKPGPCPSLVPDVPTGGGDAKVPPAATVHPLFAKHFAGWAQNLDAPEKQAVANYQGTTLYRNVNANLRGKGKGGLRGVAASAVLAVSPKQKAMIAGLDSAIAKGSIPAGTTLYRGMNMGTAAKDVDKLAGRVLADHGYPSTTTDLARAENFMTSPDSALVRIHVPADHPGAGIAAVGERWSKENEVLLPRGTRFAVKKVSRGPNGRPIVDVELLPHDPKSASKQFATPAPDLLPSDKPEHQEDKLVWYFGPEDLAPPEKPAG